MISTVFDWYILDADKTSITEGIQHGTLVMPVSDIADFVLPSGTLLHVSRHQLCLTGTYWMQMRQVLWKASSMRHQ